MKKFKALSILALLVLSLLSVGLVEAAPVPVQIDHVWINDRSVDSGDVRAVDRGDTLNVEVKLLALSDADNVEVEGSIRGYEYGDKESLVDSTHVFKVEAGETYFKDLQLKLPTRLDKDRYSLRIVVNDRSGDSAVFNVELAVKKSRHSVKIKDVVLSPGLSVEAGRSLLGSVRLENFGEKDENGVKVTLKVPELGLEASDYLDKIKSGDSETSEELYLRLPSDTAAGEYKALVEVSYDEAYRTDSEEFTLTVKESSLSKKDSSKTVVTVGPETQDVAAGSEVAYPVALTNEGSDSKTFTLEAATGDWGTTRLSDSVVVLGAGETKVAYLYVKADEGAAAGEKAVTLNVGSEGNTLRTVTLKANVTENTNSGSWTSVRKGLETALVVLVVLLVIVGLVVGFSKLKNDNEDEEQEYY